MREDGAQRVLQQVLWHLARPQHRRQPRLRRRVHAPVRAHQVLEHHRRRVLAQLRDLVRGRVVAERRPRHEAGQHVHAAHAQRDHELERHVAAGSEALVQRVLVLGLGLFGR